jgi:nitroreductase
VVDRLVQDEEISMEAIEAIMTRRSVRRFTESPVTDAELEVVLRAAMNAPSAGNEQPWRFVVVRERDNLRRLSKVTPFAGLLADAGAGIVVCADRRALKYPVAFWPMDTSAAVQNLLLAAHATGLGGVWIGVHPVAPFKAAVRRIVRLPRVVVPVSLVALGHPASVPPPIERYDVAFVHHETWAGHESNEGVV